MIKFLNTTKISYLINDVLYSYKTPVAKVDGATLLVDDVYYSNTTSKQITQCANKLGLIKKRVKNLFN